MWGGVRVEGGVGVFGALTLQLFPAHLRIEHMHLEYDLSGAGWATAWIRSDDGYVEAVTSYLHDTLRELAQAAIDLCRRAPEATVVFMDEPGEYHLVLTRKKGNELLFEVRWFKDWASWGMYPKNAYRVELQGSTTVERFRDQVLGVLDKLDQTLGPTKYREEWIEADFPTAEYETLSRYRYKYLSW